MGMGAAAAHADCIEWDSIKKIVPQESAAFEAVLADLEMTLGGAASILDECGPEHGASDLEDSDEVKLQVAYTNLQDAFITATTVGESNLELWIGYYDSESGDRYDDLSDEHYFSVNGVYQHTPAGERFKDVIERKSWTQFG
jgi:hypothetical protein